MKMILTFALLISSLSAMAKSAKYDNLRTINIGMINDSSIIGPQGPESFLSMTAVNSESGDVVGRLTCDLSHVTTVDSPEKVWQLSAGNHFSDGYTDFDFSSHGSCFSIYEEILEHGVARISLDMKARTATKAD